MKMTEQEFLYIQDKSKYYNYSSLRYTNYDEVSNYKVIVENEYVILIYGYNYESKIYEYHWMANNDEELVNAIGANTSNVIITFIPNEWILNFENSGFKMFAK
ncbi:MAG: hypothetical protein ACRDA5_07515, partial [Clostridium sp.]